MDFIIQYYYIVFYYLKLKHFEKCKSVTCKKKKDTIQKDEKQNIIIIKNKILER